MNERTPVVSLLVIGLVAGGLSGLMGVGGGVVMVPLLVIAGGLSQHRAHATSLAAIVPIALVAGARFAVADEVDYGTAATLAVGAVAGAQIGARVMARTSEGALRVAFGVLMIAVGVVLAWP